MNKVTLLDIEFHFGIGFLNELIDGTGLAIEELGIKPDAVLVPQLMYYSRLYAAKRERKEIDFDIYTINEIIDNNGGIGGEFWNKFKIAFNESMFKDVPKDDDNKKKVKAQK